METNLFALTVPVCLKVTYRGKQEHGKFLKLTQFVNSMEQMKPKPEGNLLPKKGVICLLSQKASGFMESNKELKLKNLVILNYHRAQRAENIFEECFMR